APGLDRVDVVQPVLWAVMVSLAALWESFGVRPAAVVGHSQGEIAAAVVAGALSVVDGARVVALRSRALVALAGGGGMVSVGLAAGGSGGVSELVGRWGGRVSVAAVNGPSSTVVSGDVGALDELVEWCEGAGVRVRRIDVDYASHSVHVDVLEGELAGLLGSVRGLVPSVPFLSTVTGEWVEGAVLDGGYWFRNLRQSVLLEPVVRRLVGEGFGAFLEMSPHPVLTVPIGETVEAVGSDAVVVGSLRRGEGGLGRFYRSLGEAWVRGVGVDWAPVFAGLSPCRVELPTYAFQRSRYWLEVPKPAVGADPVEEEFWRTVEEGDLEELAGTLGVAEGLESVVPALAAWRTAHRERGVVDGWRHRVEWRPLTATVPTAAGGTWLIVVPESMEGDHLVTDVRAELEARGARAVVAAVDAARLDRAALGELLTTADVFAGVLSLLALDERPHPRQPAVPLGLAGTLTLLQALGDVGIDAPLWCVTRGAVAVGDDHGPAAPEQAGVWGIGRSAALEHPKRWGGLVDLPQAGANGLMGLLLDAVTAGVAEDQVALRDGRTYGRRLVQAATRGKRAPRDWRPRGTVLVTGGTGALGAHVARWLATRGAEHLVLTGRRGDGAHLAGLRDELAHHGTRITVAACDTADRQALADLVDGLAGSGSPVRSVVHAAGVSVLGPIAETGVDDLAATLSGKVLGAAHLDDVLDTAELDAVVYFSSISGTWGVADHAAYGAANAILDARAERRRADGAPVLSVAWGPWAGGGMIAESVQNDLRRRGVPVIEPATAITGLQQALDHEDTVVAVADVDWRRFAEVFTSVRGSALLSELAPSGAGTTETAAGAAQGDGVSTALREMADLEPERRTAALRALIGTHVAAALGHEDAEAVSVDAAFKDLGFDSLTAVALRDRVHRATGLKLPTTVVFDHPSISALAACVDDLAFGGGGGGGDSPTVGLLLPGGGASRFGQFDKPLIEKKLRELCPSCPRAFAATPDPAMQRQQLESMITRGVDVLIIAAVDPQLLRPSVEAAHRAGIPVVAYDRLAQGPISGYVTFDGAEVGKLQGTALLKAMGAKVHGGQIVMMNGATSDPNAGWFKRGALSVLSGKVRIGKSYDTVGWRPENAFVDMRAAIAALGADRIDGVLAANDSLAGAVISALKATEVRPLPPVTGQDADLAAVRRIVEGDQYMTVYKPYKPAADAAVEMAVALGRGKSVTSIATGTVDNAATKDIPAVLLPAVPVTVGDIKDTLVKDGMYTIAQICPPNLRSACAKAGLTP
ncbi:SDR family NAD(P)-dependent oxidoreductase, partial [Streptomyces sp. IBSBF 2806]|uniref:SDR family NAD(P)-dependent oxidoreductase n=1 Tax=Streptomyces sp. IBSBF 2806 TaxID=2903529 RepID=UPI003FA7ABB8